MKRKQARLKVERLFILGAGSSYSLSYIHQRKDRKHKTITPLDWDFLDGLNTCYTNGWLEQSIRYIEKNWLDEGNLFNEPLEQAIIKRVSQYEFLSKINPERTRNKCDNKEYLNHITHLVAAYLLNCRNNRKNYAKTFINTIFPIGEKLEDNKNRIITFNYDSLVDKVLMERGISNRKIYFDRIAKTPEDGIRRNKSQKFIHPLILKLHGSANWRCNKEDFEKMVFGTDLTEDEKFVVYLSEKAPKPDDSESPLIIPPIPNKPVTRVGLFKYLWQTAFEYIHEAREIVIVGYSCPSTDTLARAMFTHFRSNNLDRIAVVDPNAGVLKNYRDMIKSSQYPTKVKWNYYGSFDDFIENGL
jgi:hypothetical protein